MDILEALMEDIEVLGQRQIAVQERPREPSEVGQRVRHENHR